MSNQDELTKAWQELSSDSDSEKLHLNAGQPSKLPIETLRRNLKIKLGFTLGISLIWVGFILFYPETEVKFLFGLLLLAYTIGSALLIRELRIFRTAPFSDEDLRKIDKSAEKAGLKKMSVFAAKNSPENIARYADLTFRRDALLGLERYKL